MQVAAGGVELVTRAGQAPWRLSVGAASTSAGEQVPAARLWLRAGAPSRWSVVDDRGVAWFPDGALRKWDADGTPMFHGDDLELDVPAVPLTVTCGRGMEFETARATITPDPGATVPVTLDPRRLHDPAAHGWYGGDLHVHMNYSGDLVVAPQHAAEMQLGEGLHLMHLVAGNIGSTRVYDRDAFEATVGADLPWSTDQRVARFGVEYRNDLLGHVHGFGLTGVPTRYSTGHAASDHPDDWPANAHACAELRELGATVGYTHPVFSPLSDGTPAEVFGFPRSVEARELVADAALGLVDSIDLLGPNDAEGTTLLYHHLLNTGLRLAATAGTDVWLSFSSGPLISNPPGWARVYADLRGAPLSVAAFQEAIRAGRTLATTGPWLDLTVDGRGPGDVIAADPATAVPVERRVHGARRREPAARRAGRRTRRERRFGDRDRRRRRRVDVARGRRPRTGPPVGARSAGVRPHQPRARRGARATGVVGRPVRAGCSTGSTGSRRSCASTAGSPATPSATTCST